MKLLSDILYKVRLEEVVGTTHLAVETLCFDSRKAHAFGCFIALPGTASDGHAYVDDVVAKGVVAVVCERLPEHLDPKVTYVRVRDSHAALGVMAANFYDHPSTKLKLVGITGTNGKTTSATLLYKLFQLLGYKTGLISTVQHCIHHEVVPSTHTTPDALTLNELLTRMVKAGVTHCFMEVSSHAVVQRRIEGLVFTGAAFTNITHDHLDYHGTFDAYLAAKKGFFDQLSAGAFALVNKDDRNGKVMVQNTKAKRNTYALQQPADFKGKIMEASFSGLLMDIDHTEVWVKLIGQFNAYNVMLVYGVAKLLGEQKTNILTALSNLDPVDGRFQFVRSADGITAIVDYAHTPDALQNVLGTIHELRTRNEQVITVVGCGGDRDALKRPIMAKIACEASDKVILTSDNPRSEDPESILSQMDAGVEPQHRKKVLKLSDRREAIKTACLLAKPGDILLIAGKGHEKYQEIKGVKHPFDDLQELKNALTSQ